MAFTLKASLCFQIVVHFLDYFFLFPFCLEFMMLVTFHNLGRGVVLSIKVSEPCRKSI
jgi:hypothetical protein